MTSRGAVLRTVHHALVVLDSHSDRERLVHEMRPAEVQQFEGVARAVARRQDDRLSGEFLASAIAVCHNATELVVCIQDEVGQRRPEKHLAAERLDLLAQSFSRLR